MCILPIDMIVFELSVSLERMMQISTQQVEKFTLLADKENRVTPASSVDMGEKLMGQIVKYHIISNFPQERICVC